MFPSYSALDVVEAGDPGKRLFKLIEQKGVIPIAWGEIGYRELMNEACKYATRGFRGSNFCVAPVRSSSRFSGRRGEPGHHNLHRSPEAFRWRKWTGKRSQSDASFLTDSAVQKYVTVWHYAIDPTILAVRMKTDESQP